ncbi:MAG: low affinity iron permease family protein [Methyloceanibacter sp.]
MAKKGNWFVRFAQYVSHVTGRPIAFILAVGAIVVWGCLGPVFGYSDTWQLVINTATTIITFLMVFVIQNTQNRDTSSLHIKLDELILVTQKASNRLLDLDDLDDVELEKMKKEYGRLAQKTVAASEKRAQRRASAKRTRTGKD